MKKSYKILLTIVLIIAVILIINEFVLFPIFPSSTTSASCVQSSLFTNESFPKHPGLVNRAEIILTGIAGDYKWVTTDPSKGHIETHTIITVDDVVKGNYNNKEITVRAFGGCNVRLNYCVMSSISESPWKDNKYLLFLSNPDDNGVYDGFSACGGIYTITLDDSGNEVVWCFAKDIENCANGYVKLDDLTKQIQS